MYCTTIVCFISSYIHTRVQLFAEFSVHQPEVAFSLPLNTLIHTLEFIAPGDLGDLILRYPGPEQELLVE